MNKTIQLKNKTTITHFQVQKPIYSLLVSVEFEKDEKAYIFLYNPNKLFCGILAIGMSNFINEIYISNTMCTLNGRAHELLAGNYTVVIFPIHENTDKQSDITLVIDCDVKKEYDKKYCQDVRILKEYDFEQLIDTRHRYFKGDLHGHTIFSDGHNSILEAAEILREQELDFMAFTEHNSQSFSDDYITCLSIPSFELTLPMGHMNIHGVIDMDVLFQNLPQVENYNDVWNIALECFHRESNISLNHMFLEPWHFTYMEFDLSKLNTIEIICDPTYPTAKEANDKAVAFLDYLWEEGLKIYAIGGSDSHNKKDEFYEGVLEASIYGDPATYVYCQGLSINNVLRGIKNGNSYVARYISLDINICNGKYLPGSIITGEEEIYYQVTVNNIKKNMIGRFIFNNEIVKEVILSENITSASYTIVVNDNRWWLRFGVYDMDGHVIAYVNPIFNKEKVCANSQFNIIRNKFEKVYNTF